MKDFILKMAYVYIALLYCWVLMLLSLIVYGLYELFK